MKSAIFLSRYEAKIYAILRVVAGFLFLWHGSQKLFDFPTVAHEIPPYITLIAGPVEFFGGLMIMIGLWTPWAAFICCGEMAYAYWTVHGIRAVLPVMNGGELSLIYCFLFLYIASRGSGLFSADHLWEKKKQNQPPGIA